MTLDFLGRLAVHAALSAGALAIALALGLPLGAWIARSGRVRASVLAGVNTARVVPSLAVLMLMLPLFGIGPRPALVALTLLALPPIVVNTDLGLRSVPRAVREAALGLGMTTQQLARRVEWPLAFPIVFGGVRTATVEVIASATLAAFIGGGGLGEYITDGLANADTGQLLLGGVSVALLALGAELGLTRLGRRLSIRT